MNAVPVYFFPTDMCETCISEMDSLITSGEFSEFKERMDEITLNGYECLTCLQLEKENN